MKYISLDELTRLVEENRKLECIKYIKNFFMIGLKECKDLVDINWGANGSEVLILKHLQKHYDLIGTKDDTKEELRMKIKIAQKLQSVKRKYLNMEEREFLIKYLTK